MQSAVSCLSCVALIYITVQGMKQQVHSASSPHGQLRQPVLIVLTGLEMEEVVLEVMLPGILAVCFCGG